MFFDKFLVGLGLTVLSACGIPPVDRSLISTVPASAPSFAIAQRAVQACTGFQDRDRTLTKFRRAGFGVSREQIQVRNDRMIERVTISAPDDAVSVLLEGNQCIVGLEGMTPKQSAQLAQRWVAAYDAKANSEFADGLSDHVSGAWRNIFTEPARVPDKAAFVHKIYIAAYKTFPQGPYDPQRDVGYNIEGTFPDAPGAAVKLTHVIECQPQIVTGPRSGAFLPCSEPMFDPQ